MGKVARCGERGSEKIERDGRLRIRETAGEALRTRIHRSLSTSRSGVFAYTGSCSAANYVLNPERQSETLVLVWCQMKAERGPNDPGPAAVI